MYTVCKIKKYNFSGLLKVSKVLYDCGKDMALKYDLQHWNNSHLKNWIILGLCAIKNNIYLVFDKKTPVATFQTRKNGDSFLFQKLATSPDYSGRGVGSFCINKIEEMGKALKCKEVVCEVYEKSEHAKRFYENRGYIIYGTTDTLKYRELKLKKKL